jgi:hypothetical protein
MMDCVEAQSLVSEAMDRQPVAPALLAEAKEHCRTCPECAAFVKAQLVAKNAPLPAPPADLADRVMGQIRAEAEAKAAAVAAAEERARAAESEPEQTVPIATLAPPPARKRKNKLPRMWVSAAAAAAVIVALVGTGAVVVVGMKAMSGVAPTPTQANRNTTYEPESSAAQAPAASAAGTDGGAFGSAPTGAQDTAAATKSAGPQFITLNGIVYSWTGADGTDIKTLKTLGTTVSSLSRTGQAVPHTVYGGKSADTVYVVDAQDAVQAFSRVTRVCQGKTYVLLSAEIAAFGQWPTLPQGLTPPTSADGSPTFVTGATDSSGVQTYRPAVAQGVDGIAVAPSTDSGLMQGNPNWTWWVLSR